MGHLPWEELKIFKIWSWRRCLHNEKLPELEKYGCKLRNQSVCACRAGIGSSEISPGSRVWRGEKSKELDHFVGCVQKVNVIMIRSQLRGSKTTYFIGERYCNMKKKLPVQKFMCPVLWKAKNQNIRVWPKERFIDQEDVNWENWGPSSSSNPS